MQLTPKGSSLSELIIEVFRVNRLLLDAGDALTAPVGLSSARWQVLGIVEHGPVSVADVARRMGLTRQTVQQTADGLQVEGFIEYVENPNHRRAKWMQLTPSGQKAMAFVARVQARWANEIAAPQTLRDLQAALTALQNIRETLEESVRPARETKAVRRVR